MTRIRSSRTATPARCHRSVVCRRRAGRWLVRDEFRPSARRRDGPRPSVSPSPPPTRGPIRSRRSASPGWQRLGRNARRDQTDIDQFRSVLAAVWPLLAHRRWPTRGPLCVSNRVSAARSLFWPSLAFRIVGRRRPVTAKPSGADPRAGASSRPDVAGNANTGQRACTPVGRCSARCAFTCKYSPSSRRGQHLGNIALGQCMGRICRQPLVGRSNCIAPRDGQTVRPDA
jgi:hypothetical protein